MAANEIGVPGSHNVENALATIAVAKLRDVDNQTIKETLSAFGGVKHRLQFVDDIKGVKFITTVNQLISWLLKKPYQDLTTARSS